MVMIKKHYYNQLESEADVRLALNVWILQPDSSRSLMPAHAITKHGLMPPLQLTDEERVAVIDYILQLKTHAKGMMDAGECSNTGKGKANMKHGTMEAKPDSSASQVHECSMMNSKPGSN